MVTIYDVAERAGVSVATVSAVVNNSSYVSPQLRQNVELAIAELNYQPNLLARSLAKRKTHTVGMLIPDIANPYYSEIVRGAEDKMQEAGYTMLLGNSDNRRDKEEVYLNLILSKRVDGILLIKSPGEMSSALLEKMRHSKTPVVLIDREYPQLEADTILANDLEGAYQAVSHLIGLRHRRVGIITGPRGLSTVEGRFSGYQRALEEKHIPFDLSLVVQGDYDIASGCEAGLLLLRQKPTAVFVTNYLMTVGFMTALEKLELRCPEDIAVVSYDDVPWSDSFRPKLTCVEQPKYLLGYRGAEMLFSRILGKHKRKKIEVLNNEFHVRDSCGYRLPRHRKK
jgi:DNA-binding LacI/PurR family transcriptional regulator